MVLTQLKFLKLLSNYLIDNGVTFFVSPTLGRVFFVSVIGDAI